MSLVAANASGKVLTSESSAPLPSTLQCIVFAWMEIMGSVAAISLFRASEVKLGTWLKIMAHISMSSNMGTTVCMNLETFSPGMEVSVRALTLSVMVPIFGTGGLLYFEQVDKQDIGSIDL
jgi:hypothetical protein